MRIAVVGVGAAGLATALALTDRIPTSLDLTLFDPLLKDPAQSGRGLPYQEDCVEPLLNAPPSTMSVRVDDHADFSRWLSRNRGNTDGLLSRPVFGRYLSETFQLLQRRWITRDGMLHCAPVEALSITRSADGRLSVATSDAYFTHFDVVFLCTGWAKAASSGRRTVPAYPLHEMTLRALGTGHVGVVGSGLAAIDVVRALLSRGYRGHITLASRRGLLPGPRVERDISPLIMTRERLAATSTLNLREFLRLIDVEAKAHGICLDMPERILGGKLTLFQSLQAESPLEQDWRALFVALCDEAMTEAWHVLDRESRSVFQRWLHPYFQAWCNPMPASVAKKVSAALASGQLMVKEGLRRFDHQTLVYSGGRTQEVDLVIAAQRNATEGIADIQSPLIKSLIGAGLAIRDDFGGLSVANGSWRLLGRTDADCPIYAIGSLAQGSRYYVNALDSILRTIPEAISDAIRRRGHGSEGSGSIG